MLCTGTIDNFTRTCNLQDTLRAWHTFRCLCIDSKELSDQGIKFVFFCNLWAWSKLFSSSIIDFVDWIATCWGVLFFVRPSFLFMVLLVLSVYSLCTMGALFWSFLSNAHLFYLSKKLIMQLFQCVFPLSYIYFHDIPELLIKYIFVSIHFSWEPVLLQTAKTNRIA